MNTPSNSFKHQKQQKRCDDKNDAFITTGQRNKYKLIQHHLFLLPQRRSGKHNNPC